MLFVEDLVDAVRRFAGSGISGVFNIGGGPGNTLSLLELLSMLREMGLRPEYRFSAGGRLTRRCTSPTYRAPGGSSGGSRE